jgi:hypothetical protein
MTSILFTDIYGTIAAAVCAGTAFVVVMEDETLERPAAALARRHLGAPDVAKDG